MTEKVKYNELSEKELFRVLKKQYESMEKMKIKDGCYVTKDREDMNYLLLCVDKFIGNDNVGVSDYKKWFLYWSFRDKYHVREEMNFKKVNLMFNKLAIMTYNFYGNRLMDIKGCIAIYWNLFEMLINFKFDDDIKDYFNDFDNVLEMLKKLFDVYMLKMKEFENINKDGKWVLALDYLKDNL